MPSIMPLSALASALRGAGRQNLTASTIAAARKEVTGSHVFRIQGYTQAMRKTIPTGRAITSTSFRVGGNSWKIECYPNGKDEEHRGYTSLFLKPGSAYYPARFGLTLLGAAGKPTSCARATEGHVHFYYNYTDLTQGWKDFVRNGELKEGEHLVDDCLTVLCDVTVDQGILADKVDAEKRVNWSKEPTDVTLHVGGKTFPAHRWVLESRSPVFEAALENTSKLDITDMDAQVLDALLQFMYADDAMPAALPLKDAKMAEGLLVAADRYGLEKLKLACEAALCAHHVNMDSVAAMLALAERHGCAGLKEACMQLLSSPDNLTSFMSKHIADMDAQVFALLQFLYADGALSPALLLKEPTMAEGLLVAADKYGLLDQKLKLACESVLCAHVDMGSVSVAAMLALAERHGCADLKEACIEFLSCHENLTAFMATDGFEN